MKPFNHIVTSYSLIGLFSAALGCGVVTQDSVKRYDAAHGGALSRDANTTETKTAAKSAAKFVCKVPKNDLAFATSVVQSAFARPLKEEEKAQVVDAKGKFDRIKFVEQTLASPEISSGVSKFLGNLLRLNKLVVDPDLDDEELVADAVIVADLQKEPTELVLRNLDKPWSYFFTTTDFYCTKNTAPIYNYPESESGAFVPCKMPDDRAGFLGLASVLRANSSSMIATNNNYHRVAFSMYLAQGFKLLDATNGPKGEGLGIPLPACVPTTDMRVDRGGLVYGTAAIPAVGSVCASCHSTYNGPLSVPFRRFKPNGTTYSFDDIERTDGNLITALGTSKAQLRILLNETNSCWSADGIAPPQKFNGIPGLGRLIVESGTLPDALGIQVPKMLANVESDPNIQASVKEHYLAGKETLLSAFKGFYLSESFQCSDKGE